MLGWTDTSVNRLFEVDDVVKFAFFFAEGRVNICVRYFFVVFLRNWIDESMGLPFYEGFLVAKNMNEVGS